MQIRRFCETDADGVSRLIGRNFIEINSKDYPLSEMRELAKLYDKNKVISLATSANMYVVLDNDTVVGTGSIGSLMGNKKQCILLAIYVLPEYHAKGIGKKIMHTLEQDKLFLNAERIEVHASITACLFYQKYGYTYKNGKKELDDSGLYRLEKFREIGEDHGYL